MSRIICRTYKWDYTTETIKIPPNVTLPVSPSPGNGVVKVVFAAEMLNPSHVCIGQSNLVCSSVLGTTNGAQFQLNPGSTAIIEVDDPENEEFDLARFFVAHTSTAFTMLLFVTSWKAARGTKQ